MGQREVRDFLGYLANRLGLGASSQNQAHAAVVFFFRAMLRRDLGGHRGVARARQGQVTPRYATPEQIDHVFRRMSGPSLTACMLMYGSGTRVSETLSVRLKDLDLARRELTVREGKGARDRVTVLASAAVPALEAQIETVLEQHRSDRELGRGWAPLPGALHRKDPTAGFEIGWQFLFPSTLESVDPKTGRVGRRHLHPTSVQRHLKRAVREADTRTPISCHVLRHCFATEMLRAGCNVRTLQKMMGHRDLKTTARYLHTPGHAGTTVQSPLDRLPSALLGRLGPPSQEADPS